MPGRREEKEEEEEPDRRAGVEGLVKPRRAAPSGAGRTESGLLVAVPDGAVDLAFQAWVFRSRCAHQISGGLVLI